MNLKLREVRLEKELGQWQLAKEAKVSQSKISLYERDLYPLNLREKKNSRRFGVAS